ncbi:uncharacterized protein LOC143629173 [Bidens hawaiensis]|uniref:uncharacterized protein LOC143629173 n=1 Tax=Bidens hawaiensis TaxID=980011 RepID=UPI004049CDE3
MAICHIYVGVDDAIDEDDDTNNEIYVTHVIGIIKDDIYVEDITNINGKPAKILKMKLYDSNDNSINMTLWDAYAMSVQSYVEKNPQQTAIIIVLQFATYYDEEPGVYNALSITKLFINEEIAKIVEFKKKF